MLIFAIDHRQQTSRKGSAGYAEHFIFVFQRIGGGDGRSGPPGSENNVEASCTESLAA